MNPVTSMFHPFYTSRVQLFRRFQTGECLQFKNVIFSLQIKPISSLSKYPLHVTCLLTVSPLLIRSIFSPISTTHCHLSSGGRDPSWYPLPPLLFFPANRLISRVKVLQFTWETEEDAQLYSSQPVLSILFPFSLSGVNSNHWATTTSISSLQILRDTTTKRKMQSETSRRSFGEYDQNTTVWQSIDNGYRTCPYPGPPRKWRPSEVDLRHSWSAALPACGWRPRRSRHFWNSNIAPVFFFRMRNSCEKRARIMRTNNDVAYVKIGKCERPGASAFLRFDKSIKTGCKVIGDR